LRREGVPGFDADGLEAQQAVALDAVIAPANCQPAPDQDALGQRLFELFELRHADLGEVPLGHWDRGRSEPEVAPGATPFVFAVGNFESELVARCPFLGREQLALDDAKGVLAARQWRELSGSCGLLPLLGDAFSPAIR